MGGLGDFCPGGWKDVWSILEVVSHTLGWAGLNRRTQKAFVALPLSGWVFALAIPQWADELIRGGLSKSCRRELQIIQAHLLFAAISIDKLVDGDTNARAGAAERYTRLLPLLVEAHRRFCSFFALGHPFWNDYAKLVEQQIDSARWEREGRKRDQHFDAGLVQALGRKAALARWPASAVARLANQPSSVSHLDQIFDRFLAVLQLFDDLVDFNEDARSGQVNAVLVAGRATSRHGSRFDAQAQDGALLVAATARAQLSWLQGQSRPNGYFARTCEYLIRCCRQFERQTVELAACRLAEQVCGQLLRIDAAPLSPPRARPPI